MSFSFWYFVLLWVVLVNAKTIFINFPPEHASKILSTSLDCVAKTGVEMHILKQLLNWNFQDSDRLRKFLYCFGKTSGYADEKGHFNEDMLLKIVGNNKLKNEYANVVHDCNKSEGGDKYETFYKAAVCFHEKSPILFKL